MTEYHVYARADGNSHLQYVTEDFTEAIAVHIMCVADARKWKGCTDVYIIEYDPDAHEVGKIIEQEVI